jgi:drug/metabolite transporter (DMT)-like permease
MVLLLSFVSAVFFAAAYVLQYHEAHEAPAKLFLSPRLLLELARHRIWLFGIGAMLVGDGLQAMALDKGSLAIVEPVLTASLLFALPISAAWRRERLRRREWVSAIAVSAALGVMIGVGSPTTGRSTMPAQLWIIVTLACWGGALAMVAVARRLSHQATQAALIGSAAGVLFGLQDALTRFCLHGLSHSFIGLVFSWQPYVLLITAVYGLTLTQSAYEAGPLPSALPPIVLGEPVVGMLIGVFTLNERLSATPTAIAIEIASAVVMIAGGWMLARSPLVCGKGHPSRLHLPHLPHAHQRPAVPVGADQP